MKLQITVASIEQEQKQLLSNFRSKFNMAGASDETFVSLNKDLERDVQAEREVLAERFEAE